MNEPQANIDQTETDELVGEAKPNGSGKPRPGFRIHPATWVALFGVFAVWAFLALPGKRYFFSSPAGVGVSFFQHGWPAVHYERTTSKILNVVRTLPAQAKADSKSVAVSRKEFRTGVDGRRTLVFRDVNTIVRLWGQSSAESHWKDEQFDEGPYWLKACNWKFGGDTARVVWSGLFINVSVFVAVIGGLGFLLNRRFQRHGLRIGLKGLALLTAAIGLVCMYYSSVGIFENNRIALEQLESVKLYDQADRYDIYPDVLIRLTGRRILPRADHFRSLVVDFSKVPPAERKVLGEEFRSLQYLLIAKLTSLDSAMGWCLKYLTRVEELTLIGPDLKSSQWRAIGRMDSLVNLRVSQHPSGLELRLDKEFFDSVSRGAHLESIELVGCVYQSEDLISLVRCRSLRRLTLSDCPIDEVAVSAIESMPNLVYFNANQSGLTDDQFDRIKETCPKLLIVR